MTISVSKNAPAESYYSGSVISGQAFTVTVSESGFSGTVTIYANSPTDDCAFSLGTINVNGTGSGSFTIRSVYGTDSSRKLTAKKSNGTTASILVGVWFQTTMTVECLSLYSTNYTYCGQKYSTKHSFVALPYTGICNKNIALYSTNTHNTITVPIQDAGPMLTTDNYWNGTGVPQNPAHGIDGSDGAWDALGLTSPTYYSCSSPAYGSRTVQWRFT